MKLMSMPASKPSRAHWHRDPLCRMRAFELACDLVDEAWTDAEKLLHNRITVEIAPQLYAALGSIKANLGEGYSRSSGRDRARIFEYALGSVRESMSWYDSSARVLGHETTRVRVERLEEIRRLLLTAIPRERDRLIRPVAGPPKPAGGP